MIPGSFLVTPIVSFIISISIYRSWIFAFNSPISCENVAFPSVSFPLPRPLGGFINAVALFWIYLCRQAHMLGRAISCFIRLLIVQQSNDQVSVVFAPMTRIGPLYYRQTFLPAKSASDGSSYTVSACVLNILKSPYFFILSAPYSELQLPAMRTMQKLLYIYTANAEGMHLEQRVLWLAGGIKTVAKGV